MNAALINKLGQVCGDVREVPEKENDIEVAGALGIDTIRNSLVGINTSMMKISRSIKNLNKARECVSFYRVETAWGDIYISELNDKALDIKSQFEATK